MERNIEVLEQLKIENYALIDRVEIEFGAGLSIITGQTGAGKSIILGALGLILGGRADMKSAGDATRKTIVEAVFNVPLDDADEEGSAETILRREILPSGRSRAFINDSPVTLDKLAEISARLIDIHSQNANLQLATPSGQLEVIDAMADNVKLLATYRSAFKDYAQLRRKIKTMRQAMAKTEQERSILTEKYNELKQLNVKIGEAAEVERRFDVLSDAEDINYRLGEAHRFMAGDDGSAVDAVKMAIAHLSEIKADLYGDSEEESEGPKARLQSVLVELADVADDLEQLASKYEPNPALLAKTGERMRELLDATRKFNVSTPDDLIGLQERYKEELEGLTSSDNNISALEAEARALGDNLRVMAESLSKKRHTAASKFAEDLMRKAKPLGLSNLKFEVAVEEGKIGQDGKDTVKFMCAFNKNSVMTEMSRTASGGELSRLTLAIKSIMGPFMKMPTVIFDEIDTGVSGEIAARMGGMMSEMSVDAQVIAITHLPQVAAYGNRHYKVYKEDNESRTLSHMRELDAQQRVEEIAGMLSGEDTSRAAVQAAKELLKTSIRNVSRGASANNKKKR